MDIRRKVGTSPLGVTLVDYYVNELCYSRLYLYPPVGGDSRQWMNNVFDDFNNPAKLRTLAAVLGLVASDAEQWLAGGGPPKGDE